MIVDRRREHKMKELADIEKEIKWQTDQRIRKIYEQRKKEAKEREQLDIEKEIKRKAKERIEKIYNDRKKRLKIKTPSPSASIESDQNTDTESSNPTEVDLADKKDKIERKDGLVDAKSKTGFASSFELSDKQKALMKHSYMICYCIYFIVVLIVIIVYTINYQR